MTCMRPRHLHESASHGLAIVFALRLPNGLARVFALRVPNGLALEFARKCPMGSRESIDKSALTTSSALRPTFTSHIQHSMTELYTQAAHYVAERISDMPAIAVLTGTGLGTPADGQEAEERLPYRGIPHFPATDVRGHSGELVIRQSGAHRLAIFSGRLHYYEGHSIQDCGFPIHLMHALGIKHVIMSNVSGSINPDMPQGSIAVIRDHINLMGVNPLRGQRGPDGAIAFPEMRSAYAREYHEGLGAFAQMLPKPIHLHQAVYAAFAGPSLETPQEYKMARILGADLVGMSTVPEVIVAASYGMKCNVVSLVSNECFHESPEPTSIESVLKVAHAYRDDVYKVIDGLVGLIAKTGM